MHILTQEQLAETFNVTTQTIIEWQKKGLPCLRAPGGKTVRYVLSDVVDWMKQNALILSSTSGETSNES